LFICDEPEGKWTWRLIKGSVWLEVNNLTLSRVESEKNKAGWDIGVFKHRHVHIWRRPKVTLNFSWYSPISIKIRSFWTKNWAFSIKIEHFQSKLSIFNQNWAFSIKIEHFQSKLGHFRLKIEQFQSKRVILDWKLSIFNQKWVN